MTQNGTHASHADDVIVAFKTTIGPDTVQQIGSENLANLTLPGRKRRDRCRHHQRLESIATNLRQWRTRSGTTPRIVVLIVLAKAARDAPNSHGMTPSIDDVMMSDSA